MLVKVCRLLLTFALTATRGEQSADVVAGQRDLAVAVVVATGRRSPFSASCARVAAWQAAARLAR
jgi:hypothetical protein